MTRRLKRSSGCAPPSFASGLAANASQPRRPATPMSTIVRTSASAAVPLGLGEAERAAADEARALDRRKRQSQSSCRALRAIALDASNIGLSIEDKNSRLCRLDRLAPGLAVAQTPDAADAAHDQKKRRLDLGRSLRRTARGRLSGEPPHPRPLASRSPARRSAVGADLPGDRTRGGGRRPHPSRAADGQSLAAGPDRRVPDRSDGRTTSAATQATIPAG